MQEKEVTKGTDQREIGIALIRHLLNKIGFKQPVVVLYFAPPYCPHNTLKKEDEEFSGIRYLVSDSAEKDKEIKHSGGQFRGIWKRCTQVDGAALHAVFV